MLIIFPLIYMVFGDGIWLLLSAWIIGYEIRRSEPKIVWNVLLLIGQAHFIVTIVCYHKIFVDLKRCFHINLSNEGVVFKAQLKREITLNRGRGVSSTYGRVSFQGKGYRGAIYRTKTRNCFQFWFRMLGIYSNIEEDKKYIVKYCTYTNLAG